MHIPKELLYTKEHEWVRIEDDIATVGITEFASEQLGDIVFVEVKMEGELPKDEAFGSIEAVKTVSDMFMPIGGEVIEFNEDLEDAPEDINKDPYGKGWIAKIKIKDVDELKELLDEEGYKQVIG